MRRHLFALLCASMAVAAHATTDCPEGSNFSLMVVPYQTDEWLDVTWEVKTALDHKGYSFHYFNNAAGVFFDDYDFHPFPLDSLWTNLQRDPSVFVMETHGGITSAGNSTLAAEPYAKTTAGKNERDGRVNYLKYNQYYLKNGERTYMSTPESYAIGITRKFLKRFWPHGSCFVAHACSLAWGTDMAPCLLDTMGLQMVVLMYGGSGLYAVAESERYKPWQRLMYDYGGDLASAPNAWEYDLQFNHVTYGWIQWCPMFLTYTGSDRFPACSS